MADNREKMAAIGRELASLGSRGSALEGLEQDLTAAVSRKSIKKAEPLYSVLPDMHFVRVQYSLAQYARC